MKLLTLPFVLIAMLALGCDNNQPLSMLLEESTQPTPDIAAELTGCYKSIETDAENQEYLLAFDKPCIDVLISTHYTTDEIADIVSRDDFRLEGKTIKITGEVEGRFPDTGSVILKSAHEDITIWITVPYSTAEKRFVTEATAKYETNNTYTFDVLVRYIQRDRALLQENVAEYDVWCRLIPETG